VERYDLQRKVALVTGAARGIGLETAKALAARGASVVLVDLDAGAAQRAAAEVHDTRALGIGADVTDRAAMQRAVAGAVERFGGLDVVVANAGIAPRAATVRAMAPREVRAGARRQPQRRSTARWTPRCPRSSAGAGTSWSSPRSTRSPTGRARRRTR
jgi:NAD(P)-dependent dehydrogenase (short-subunit alcohol dehydrogenase family)